MYRDTGHNVKRFLRAEDFLFSVRRPAPSTINDWAVNSGSDEDQELLHGPELGCGVHSLTMGFDVNVYQSTDHCNQNSFWDKKSIIKYANNR